jgi:DNA-binding IclR family transcriptional regulator
VRRKIARQSRDVAAEAETRIIEVLKDRPGMKTTEIAKATSSKANPTVQRLQRMQTKGLIERDEANGWTASG